MRAERGRSGAEIDAFAGPADGDADGLPDAIDNCPAEPNPDQLDASFSDVDDDGTHGAQIDWGDGSVTEGSVDQLSNGIRGSHTDTEAGVYTVSVTVTDGDGNVGHPFHQYVVISNPDGGFVTGAGDNDDPTTALDGGNVKVHKN